MTQEQVNLDEILRMEINKGWPNATNGEVTMAAMREACRQVLELAAKDAQVNGLPDYDAATGVVTNIPVINKQSILNVLNKVV